MRTVPIFYDAERRGFQESDPIADWVEAEKEIDADIRRNVDAQLEVHRAQRITA